jgi:uncharacterized membrane protein YphA (DoxX/SURF4 family)
VPQRYSISFATVVTLVALRLCIGWHFFREGVNHHLDPHWTSEAVLRLAKGPLAPLYQAYLPEFHRFDELVHRDDSQSEEDTVKRWVKEIKDDWSDYENRFAEYYQLGDAQAADAAKVLQYHLARLDDWMAANKDALATHVHEWRRKEATRASPSGELLYQKQRVAAKQGSLVAESAGWHGELKGFEDNYRTALATILDADQRDRPPLGQPRTSLDTVDDVMTYGILTIGALLILGLFTRTACVAGALFLLSVVMMQPFWVSQTAPTFNQYVEMFALLALATTHVGRWAGLDYFIHNLLSPSASRTKGSSDVSAT